MIVFSFSDNVGTQGPRAASLKGGIEVLGTMIVVMHVFTFFLFYFPPLSTTRLWWARDLLRLLEAEIARMDETLQETPRRSC